MTVKCHVCDSVFEFPEEILASMKIPSTFCDRCLKTYDPLTLRQWFKLDSTIRALNLLRTDVNDLLDFAGDRI